MLNKKNNRNNELENYFLRPKKGELDLNSIKNEDGETLVHLMDSLDKRKPELFEIMKVRSLLAQSPEELFDVAGESYLVSEHMIEYANVLPSTKEIFRKNYHRIRHELQIDKAVGLTKLLLEQIATAWLRLQIMDHEYARLFVEHHTYKEFEYWDRRLERAQTRFDRAVATLANTVKKLGPSFSIQINYAAEGGQQVNIANQE